METELLNKLEETQRLLNRFMSGKAPVRDYESMTILDRERFIRVERAACEAFQFYALWLARNKASRN